MAINRPRGTRDFLPNEMVKRREIEAILRATANNFGYKEISTPNFENAELFILKSGQEIIDQMYTFKDKSDRELALRPELTASTMRLYLSELERAPHPVKVSYFGAAFRYERPQKGRFREFWQFGLELIGADTPEAEGEVVSVAVTALMNAGLKNFVVRIGHLGILKGVFKEAGLTDSERGTIMKLLDKGEKEALLDALDGMDSLPSESRELIKNIVDTKLTVKNVDLYDVPFAENAESMDSWNKLIDVVKILKHFRLPEEQIIIDLNIARGLDYYTGLVFEIDVPELGAEKQVCGGGAYSLLELFGGKATHTIGFAVGFDRLILALEEQKRNFPEEGPLAYIIPVGEDAKPKAVEIASDLRAIGFYVELELKGRGPSKCLKHASNLGAKKAVIIGENELAEDKATVKDMASGDQEKIELQKIIDFFKSIK